jgi:hypothetical protein
MKQYHKIQTVWLRDPENNHKTLIEGAWAKLEFELLQNIQWLCTEKVDGTNIRVMWDGKKLSFGGKTDNAQISARLVDNLRLIFTEEKMTSTFGESSACLYGEGYGLGINKMGKVYLPEGVSFILFDVKIGDWWLQREDIVDIAMKLEIDHVPLIGILTLNQAIDVVRSGFKSKLSGDRDLMAEGLVCKPLTELFNRKGERIITKIKQKDFIR